MKLSNPWAVRLGWLATAALIALAFILLRGRGGANESLLPAHRAPSGTNQRADSTPSLSLQAGAGRIPPTANGPTQGGAMGMETGGELAVQVQPEAAWEAGPVVLDVVDYAGGPLFNASRSIELERGGDGVCRIPVSIRALVSVTVRAQNYAAWNAIGLRAGSAVTATLRPSQIVLGRVEDTDGKPVAGATIRVVDVSLQDLARDAMQVPALQAVSDADGAFRLAGLGVGLHAFTARTLGQGESETQHVLLPTESPLRLTVGQGARVAGIVVDAKSGQGVLGAEVRVNVAGAVIATTGSDGRFSASVRLRLAGWPLFARAPGYATGSARPTGNPSEAVIPLVPGVALSGRLVGVDARGATVRVVAVAESGEWLDDRLVRCHPEGDWSIEDVPVAQWVLLVATHRLGSDTHVARLAKEARQDLGRIECGGARFTVSGSVTGDPRGDQVALTLVPTDDASKPGWPSLVGQAYLGVRRLVAMTGSDGQYSFAHVPNGTYELRMRAPGWESRSEVIVVDGRDVRRDLGLSSAGLVTVSVRDGLGRPCDALRVEFNGENGSSHQCRRVGGGVWTLHRPRHAAELAVTISGLGQTSRLPDSRRTSWIAVHAGGVESIEVRLPGPQDIAGSLTGVEAPVGGYLRIAELRGSERRQVVEAKRRGGFVLRGVEGDVVDLQVDYMGGNDRVLRSALVRSVVRGEHSVKIEPYGR